MGQSEQQSRPETGHLFTRAERNAWTGNGKEDVTVNHRCKAVIFCITLHLTHYCSSKDHSYSLPWANLHLQTSDSSYIGQMVRLRLIQWQLMKRRSTRPRSPHSSLHFPALSPFIHVQRASCSSPSLSRAHSPVTHPTNVILIPQHVLTHGP